MPTSSSNVVLIVAPSSPPGEMVEVLGRLPNIGILYLAAALEEAGYSAVTLDRFYDNILPHELVRQIMLHNPDLIGFSLYDYNMVGTQRAIAALRRVFKGPIVVGGYTATFHAEDILRLWPEVDYVVIREGEEALVQLARHLAGKCPIVRVPNLAYRSGDRVVFNNESPLADVQRLPWPRREWPERGDATPIITRRGCMSRCTFCSMVPFYDTRLGPIVRHRTPRDVVDEIAHCVDHGSRLFVIYDDNFGLSTEADRAWAARFAEEIARRGLSISFFLEMRVTDVIRGANVLPDLCAAGLSHISVGMESMLPRQLNLYGKGYKSGDILRAVEILKRLPIDYQTNVIFWDPYITLDEALEHVELLGNLPIQDQVTSANFPFYATVLEVRRGTKLYTMLTDARILRPAQNSFYRYEYDFIDPAVRQFHSEIFPEFMHRALTPRLPHVWLSVLKLEVEGRRNAAAALRAYARALARVEFNYFRSVLIAACRVKDQARLKEQLASIHDELGGALWRCAATVPPLSYSDSYHGPYAEGVIEKAQDCEPNSAASPPQ